jgi:hypothetical protein
MAEPRHGGATLVIVVTSQPGKFMLLLVGGYLCSPIPC